jgi:hypothetical protein
MRKCGRPLWIRFPRHRDQVRPPSRPLRAAEGQRCRYLFSCCRGLLEVVVHRWTGHLERQQTYPRGLLVEWFGELWSDHMTAFFNRPLSPKDDKGNGSSLPVDTQAQENYPTLSAYLQAETWPDGSKRELSTVTLFRDAGTWRACLNERESGSVLFASSPGLLEVFLALEDRLTADHVDWRPGRSQRRKS